MSFKNIILCKHKKKILSLIHKFKNRESCCEESSHQRTTQTDMLICKIKLQVSTNKICVLVYKTTYYEIYTFCYSIKELKLFNIKMSISYNFLYFVQAWENLIFGSDDIKFLKFELMKRTPLFN